MLELAPPDFDEDAPWNTPSQYWQGLTAATAHLDAPVGVLHLGALRHNVHDMLRRAGGTPIRIASKSLRVREVIEAVLRVPGYRGVLAYTLTEAIWLAETIDDIVVGYPTAERIGIGRLATDPFLARRITLMVDSISHLDFIDSVIAPGRRESLRVCIELDASWNAPILGHLGVWRSPVREPAEAGVLASHIVSRAGFTLVGVMAYEAQIAGVNNRPQGKPIEGVMNRWMQKRSGEELKHRRANAVAAIRDHADLHFVNGGGTGSLETTSQDPSVTEIAAGSGIFGGHLFDGYIHFRPAPAAAFALDVVRKPTQNRATILGGGWIASGPTLANRQPRIVWPDGLSLVKREMAGEVQTPVTGRLAGAQQVGDRVWFRHTKSGELSEHLSKFIIIDRGEVAGNVRTYRGEGKAFL